MAAPEGQTDEQGQPLNFLVAQAEDQAETLDLALFRRLSNAEKEHRGAF